MRILLCSNLYPPDFVGGAELIAHQQAIALAQLGHAVMVFAGETRPRGTRLTVYDDELEDIPVRRVQLSGEDFDARRSSFLHTDVDRLFRVAIEDFRPDVVHFHNLVGLSAGTILAARDAGVPTVMTLHDYWGFCVRNTARRADGSDCVNFEHCPDCGDLIVDESGRTLPMELRRDFVRYCIAHVDKLVAPSRYVADSYSRAGFDPHRTEVIWNGVDIERFAKVRRTRSSRLRLSYFGYFGPHKGVDILLEAVARLRKPDEVVVNLVGSGEAEQAYVRLIEQRNLQGIVKLWGKVDHAEIERALRETDVLILPSRWKENQPVSITEAMAAGVPILASRMGGIPELVEDGRTGFLFEAGDIDALAEHIQSFVSDRRLVEAMGNAGQQRMRRSSVDTQASRLIDLYCDLLGSADDDALKPVPALCQGDAFDRAALDALHRLPAPRGNDTACLLHQDWVGEPHAQRAAFVWIVDGSRPHNARSGQQNRTRIVQPSPDAQAIAEAVDRMRQLRD